MRVRTVGLLIAVIGLFWFQFINTLSAIEIWRSGLDSLDSRPARSILIIGNSRVFYHSMPHMVRLIADSDNAPQKYQIRMRALPGYSFKDHWGSSVTQRLLSEPWDDIILQGESYAASRDDYRNDFLTYGRQLISLGQAHGKTALVANWAYAEAAWRFYAVEVHSPDKDRVTHYQNLQRAHALLARSTNARLINVGHVWEDILSKLPALPLYEGDGNHPSVAGSYLSALMIYAHLSHRNVSAASYVPSGISADQAAAIRQLVDKDVALLTLPPTFIQF